MEQILALSWNLANFIIVLSVVVFVHEMGHFLVARYNKVRCESFSIGFGPELFGLNDKYGTRWKFSIIPLGGYVKMFGESDNANPGSKTETENNDLGNDEVSDDEKMYSFKYKSLKQRTAIVFAGPAVNFLFSIVVFFFLFVFLGRPFTDPVIGFVESNSAAEEAGIIAGDKVLSINGSKIKRFEDLQRIIPLTNGATILLKIERESQVFNISAIPRVQDGTDAFGNSKKRLILGVKSSGQTNFERINNPFRAFVLAVGQTYVYVRDTLVFVWQMLTLSRGTEDLGGPFSIAKYSGQAASYGFVSLVLFMAILSINLGIINLFPIPLLDGGHLLFYAIEAIKGSPLSERVQEWGLRLGLVFVLALMLLVLKNDILIIPKLLVLE